MKIPMLPGRSLQGLGETVRELASRTLPALSASGQGRLTEGTFAPNPGQLRMWVYRPANLPRGAPLVVVLHGCGQTAASFDAGTGWSQMADQSGFALLFPEQVSANNPQTCFNWFEPGDTTRGGGEVASIAAMIEQMLGDGTGLDRRRVFVTGLSAGGAMTGALLACYPDLFAAGAVVAGLPFRTAGGMPDALDAMFRGHTQTGPVWGQRVRGAGPAGFHGPWPRISVWHGSADRTVKPMNASESVKQWLDVHGLDGPGRTEEMAGGARTVWRDRAGRAVVEQVTVPGLGHGVPVAPEAHGIGAPGPYILQSGVSSTEEIARFFGLAPATAGASRPAPQPGLLPRLLRTGFDPLRLLSRPPA